MKRLVLINGPMGVGKTAVCSELLRLLQPSVYLDGDWCWNMSPFLVTPRTKEMAMDNISFLLNRFLVCPELDNVIFGWVMHEVCIVDQILSLVNTYDVKVDIITLMCTEQTLRGRIEKDVSAGLRQPDVLERALDRLSCCSRLPYPKVWTDGLSVQETARKVKEKLLKS